MLICDELTDTALRRPRAAAEQEECHSKLKPIRHSCLLAKFPDKKAQKPHGGDPEGPGDSQACGAMERENGGAPFHCCRERISSGGRRKMLQVGTGGGTKVSCGGQTSANETISVTEA
jgi:hypothetical protein